MQYQKSLDGVRGLAILLVVVFHYNHLLEAGWVGVQLFFVLSGFLITSILLEDKKNQPLDRYLKGFYWRRTLRIFPIYYLYLLGVVGVYILTNLPENFPKTVPFLLTYTYNLFPLFYDFSFDMFFTHFWSLSIEEQFYLLWPLVIYFFNLRALRVILIVILMGAPITRYFMGEYLIAEGRLAPEFIGETVYRFTLGQWDSFAFGAAIPLFGLNTSVKRPGWLFAGAMALLVMGGVWNYFTQLAVNPHLSITSLGYPIGSMLNAQHIWSYTVLGFAAMALIIFTIRSHSMPIFENRIMILFGKLSYGLYVYHWFLKVVSGKILEPYLPGPVAFAIYLVLCIGVSYASYRIIEQPLLALKGRFFARKAVTASSSVKA